MFFASGVKCAARASKFARFPPKTGSRCLQYRTSETSLRRPTPKLDTPLEVDTKIANALLGLATEAFVAAQLASRDASITALQGAKADATLLASYATNAALLASKTTLQSALDAILAELAALQLSGSGGVVNAPARASRLGSSFAEVTSFATCIWGLLSLLRWPGRRAVGRLPRGKRAGHANAGRHRGRAAGLPDGPGPGRLHNQPNHLGAGGVPFSRRPGHGNGLEHRSRAAQLLHHRTSRRPPCRQARSHGGSLGAADSSALSGRWRGR